jgi:digeranylgeranylglycerophospholipid reductase
LEVDVLIVGAGPAGSTTARYCAANDLSVLVIDRRSEIGYPVQCGEFLPHPKEMYSMFPRSMDLEELFSLDDGVVDGESERVDLISPKGRVYRCPFLGKTLNRRKFDKYLAKRAAEAGADVKTEASLLSIKDGVARTTIGDVSAKVIVGADGPNSRTGRQSGLGNPVMRYPAVTCQADGDFEPNVKMWFGNIAPGGYAWVIPKRRGANIGAGFNPKMMSQRPSEYFERLVSKLGVKPSDVTMGFVPQSGPLKRTVKGNVLLVGDAAGHVMPTNGGGIPLAMIAGRIAGNAIREHVRAGASLSEYEVRCREVLAGPLSASLWTRRLGDLFLPSDRRTEFAMRVLGVRGLSRAIRCSRVFYIF